MSSELAMAETILRRRFRLIDAGELDALLSLYHDDAVLLRFDRALSGREALRGHFTAWLARRPRLAELTAVAATGELALYHAMIASRIGPIASRPALRGSGTGPAGCQSS